MNHEQNLKAFLSQANKLLKSQPSASDLDGADTFLRNLNAVYARWAKVNGDASGMLSELMYEAIKAMNDDEYKRIKHSSTLTTEYIQGTYPETYALCTEVQQMGYVLKSVADNYRTLISSYRLEREIDSKQVRNTIPSN